ncbi:hypothetical protein W03_16600 [Nitrosomonas sp. PY1]|uniref:hypothetical protein n=1 Tax=Nitrosomonas sp. PY1 TaxID=1803906 RepID=UPI001FC7F908|nr:hypothetical protein [Nitrosomonas sp. PY1]GKS69656.1 hypothetical protein W03_16600 [Nitrosomonas sp. PY1]
MKINTLQAILSILIVTVFLGVTAVVALTPVLGGYPPEPYTEHRKTFSALYSGIIELIVGFFFGRHLDNKDE